MYRFPNGFERKTSPFLACIVFPSVCMRLLHKPFQLLGEFRNAPGQEHYGFFSPPPHPLKISTGFALPRFSSVAKFERKMQQIYFNIFNMLPPYGIWTSEGSCLYFRSSAPGIVSCLGIPPRVYHGGTIKGWLSPAPISPKEPKAQGACSPNHLRGSEDASAGLEFQAALRATGEWRGEGVVGLTDRQAGSPPRASRGWAPPPRPPAIGRRGERASWTRLD